LDLPLPLGPVTAMKSFLRGITALLPKDLKFTSSISLMCNLDHLCYSNPVREISSTFRPPNLGAGMAPKTPWSIYLRRLCIFSLKYLFNGLYFGFPYL